MTHPTDADDDLGDLSFEQAIGRLDETVKALESGGIPLDEATRLYERGMRLARLCGQILASAELKITRIQTAYGEQMRMLEEESTGEGRTPC